LEKAINKTNRSTCLEGSTIYSGILAVMEYSALRLDEV